MAEYEAFLLGNFDQAQHDKLRDALKLVSEDYGLDFGKDVALRKGQDITHRNIRASSAGVWFGGAQTADLPYLSQLLKAKVPVTPSIAEGEDFTKSVPAELWNVNGAIRRAVDVDLIELSSVLLECLGLLRKQRRVFISYRRVESRAAAVQLWEHLGERGFDAFVDTHDIRPGIPFQEELWHKLCDCDVLIMLDTPTYFESKWTREELGKALAKEIHVIRVLWPAQAQRGPLSLSKVITLEHGDLENPKGPFTHKAVSEIALAVEQVRSHSIASRHRSMSGKIRVAAEGVGCTIEGIGAHRAITVRLLSQKRAWIYPAVGLPTAETLHDVASKAAKSELDGSILVAYDSIGLRDFWQSHIEWLNHNMAGIQLASVNQIGWKLAELGNA